MTFLHDILPWIALYLLWAAGMNLLYAAVPKVIDWLTPWILRYKL